MGDATSAVADLGSEPLRGSIQDDPDPAHAQGNGTRRNGFKKSPFPAAGGAGAGAGAGAPKEKRNSLHKGCSPPASSPRLKASRSNFTVPQPFSLTTEKRATAAGSKPTGNGVPTPSKASQKITPKKGDFPAHPAAKSFASSPSPDNLGATTPKSRAEFVFRSDERAQKRMEFYANLTEKTKAREAERNRIQASTQQQVAAEIKKLRKDQSFKATPMPKFYQEPPPVRIDVKKTPPTRPKSPKLGRRGSGSSGTEAPPKIIARRSSDEYDVSKVPNQLVSPELTPHADHANDAAEVGSEHSSRKSDSTLVPKAALSEDEDHPDATLVPKAALSEDGDHHDATPIPKAALSEDGDHHDATTPIPKAALSEEGDHLDATLIPKAALSEDDHQDNVAREHEVYEVEDHHHSLETSRSSNESPVSAVDEDLDAALQLPVSSSLLDDGDDDDLVHQELGSEDDDPDDEFPSPTSDHGVENGREESVRVFISEEFRQAAAHHNDDDDRPNEEEEEEEDDDDEEEGSGAKVYVNMDGMRAEKEDEDRH